MGYLNETQEAICECNIKKQLSMVSDILTNKEQFFKNFKDINSIFNFKVIKCYNYLFDKAYILQTNFGNYICVPIILFFLFFSLIFFIIGFSKLKLQIKTLFKKIEIFNKVEPESQETKKKSLIESFNKSSKVKGKINQKTTKENKIRKKALKKQKIMKPKKRIKFGKKSTKKQMQLTQSNVKKKSKTINIENKLTKLVNSKKNNNKLEERINYTDTEMNSFTYLEALQKDKRTCIQYYFSLLRTKHEVIFSFYPTVDYNSIYIKISLLLFTICLYYSVSALFYNDSTIHEIYESQGLFSFMYRLPQIIYSTLISWFISLIIRFLSLSEDDVLKIKKMKKIINIRNTESKLFRCLTFKFIFFYIIGIIFLLVFWIYLATFCFVYKNTQYYVIKDVSISFGLSLIYPLFYNILPGIFRIPSLKNKNRKYLYIISKILQLF